jgi:hypothetical protein
MTEKDREDLAYGLELGVEWVALSFVQRPEDIEEAAALIKGRAGILAKLEKPAAIQALDGIVALTDAVMVARGDLGVEMPPEDVPVLQRRIIAACRSAGKPVVVATQMLDSMVERPIPTRAEASDVATAVYSGADAVMLSAETAVGEYPVESVEMMNRIIERVEIDPIYRESLDKQRQVAEPTTADAVAVAAAQIASTLHVNAIATYTTSGSTTLRVARERPSAPILGLTPARRDGPAPRLGLGGPLRRGPGRQGPGRHGHHRDPSSEDRRLREGRRSHRNHRRRPVRDARKDQSNADRADRRRRRELTSADSPAALFRRLGRRHRRDLGRAELELGDLPERV